QPPPQPELMGAVVRARRIGEARLPAHLDGSQGENRRRGAGALEAASDCEAVGRWLSARAANENTYAQYRREAERILLWCLLERGKPLSSITAADAVLWPRWLEELGRLEPKAWARKWTAPQHVWIGPRNAPRSSPEYRPYNGPSGASSRKASMTAVRLLFGFLMRTGYLLFNPFDQVSAKVRLLPGERAPQPFADRSLSDSQWSDVLAHLAGLPDTLATARIRVILSLAKGLGMRATEVISAQSDWFARRRIGDETMLVIEVIGKGDKIRTLPVPAETLEAIDAYFKLRGLPPLLDCPPGTPVLDNLGVGRRAQGMAPGLSRSGMHTALKDFFEGAARIAEAASPADANKLRAGSAHWLRHTFAVQALEVAPVNVVQTAMGHASIKTTGLYLRPEDVEVAKALGRMKPL
ncbi:MAG: tyrosine-type recombinase/integrase, partial [Duodenibacillus sp.]|nr:tyrosine-type recombinase/integrase [Duodenibacillus sp.]